jgi:hypothetical protein
MSDVPTPPITTQRIEAAQLPQSPLSGRVDMTNTASDTDQYVNALRSSSDRARYALYAVIVATVLIFVVNHNVQKDSWPRRRLDTWYSYARADGSAGRRKLPEEIANGDPERLKALREEYVKQFAARSIFNASPLPGVSIDVNDLGWMGGLTLSILMLFLVLSISKEHENLHLALYKVRLLAAHSDPSGTRADSRANLLYHALAMTQVLNSPPSLARWHRQSAFNVPRLIFIIPFFVYAVIVKNEAETSYVSYIYNVKDATVVIILEILLTACIFFLGLLAWLHSSAMSARWTRAFYRVNPSHEAVARPRLSEWLQITAWSRTRAVKEPVITKLVDELEVITITEEINIDPVTISCGRRGLITQSDLRSMRCQLKRRGRHDATIKCKENGLGELPRLLRFSTVSSVLEGQLWTVTGTWSFCYVRETPGSAPTVATPPNP